MTFLVDSHLLIWAAEDKLPNKANAYFDNQDNLILFSSASIWEIAIKSNQNRPAFQIDPDDFLKTLLSSGYYELPVTSEHGIVAGSLPLIHKDPFDRMLIAQSKVEGVTLLTSDDFVRQYPGDIIYIKK